MPRTMQQIISDRLRLAAVESREDAEDVHAGQVSDYDAANAAADEAGREDDEYSDMESQRLAIMGLDRRAMLDLITELGIEPTVADALGVPSTEAAIAHLRSFVAEWWRVHSPRGREGFRSLVAAGVFICGAHGWVPTRRLLAREQTPSAPPSIDLNAYQCPHCEDDYDRRGIENLGHQDHEDFPGADVIECPGCRNYFALSSDTLIASPNPIPVGSDGRERHRHNALVCPTCQIAWDFNACTRQGDHFRCPTCNHTEISLRHGAVREDPWAFRGYRVATNAAMDNHFDILRPAITAEDAAMTFLTQALWVQPAAVSVRSETIGYTYLSVANLHIRELANTVRVQRIYGGASFAQTRQGIYRSVDIEVRT